jgi:hypothetical protein
MVNAIWEGVVSAGIAAISKAAVWFTPTLGKMAQPAARERLVSMVLLTP